MTRINFKIKRLFIWLTSWPSRRSASCLKYRNEIFCCVHMKNCLVKRNKDEIKLQNNFFRVGKNLTWETWQLHGVCTNSSIKNVTKHSNSLVLSDLKMMRSRAGSFHHCSNISLFWAHLIWAATEEEDVYLYLCLFWDQTANFEN